MSKKRSEAARELSKKGASKGGKARANVLSASERSEIARRGAKERWKKTESAPPASPPPPAEGPQQAPADDRPPYSMLRGTLKIGDVEFECHVLNDLRRVLTQREVVRVVSGGRDSSNLLRYLERNPLYKRGEIVNQIIAFQVPGVPQLANGYEATVLLDIADLYLNARDDELLKTSQLPLAATAEAITRACARVGIIALIDEATGYQELREKQALQLKLQAFIADDMQEWAKMFPDEFWFELARLEGTHYSARHRPLRWGKYVMAFVYDAVDKDVANELRNRNPDPHHGQNHHQWLKNHGRSLVNNQIQQVIAVMKLCKDMPEFREKFSQVFDKSFQPRLDGTDWGDLRAA